MLFLIKSAAFSGATSLVGLLLFLFCVRPVFGKALARPLVGVLAYCIAIVWLCPNVIVHQLAAFLTVPLFGRKRGQTAAIYMFALLVMPGVSYALRAGGVYLLVWDNFLSITVGALITTFASQGRARNYHFSAGTACAVAVFAVFLMPVIRETTATNMMRAFLEQTCLILLPFYTVYKAVKTPADLRLVLLCIVAAAASLSVLALYEARAVWPIYRAAYEHYGIVLESGNSVKMRGGLLRASGPYPEPTSFAIWLSFAAFIALTGRWMFASRVKHVLICGLLLAGMFAPQSRGAWLGLVSAYLIYQIGTGRVAAMVKGGAIATGLAIIGYIAALNITKLGNMLGLNEQGVIGPDYRQQLFTRGMEEARHHLLFGTDLQSVMTSLADLRQGEGIIDFVNTYLYVLLVAGLVGLTVFTLAITIPIFTMWRKASLLPAAAKPLPSVIAALLGSMAIMIFFTSLTGRSTMGVAILLGIAASIARMRAAEFTVTPRPARRRVPLAEQLRIDRGGIDGAGPPAIA